MNETDRRLARAVAARSGETETLLRELVEINSFTRNAAGVDRTGALLADRLACLGFACVRTAPGDPEHGQHLVLHREGRASEEIALVSHLDTVYPVEEERRHGFRWRAADERLVGPGVADIKGGSTVLVAALEAIAAAAPAAFEQAGWRVLLNAAEEEGNDVFPPLARRHVGPRTRACLVFEHGTEHPGGAGGIVVGRRGAGRLVVTVHGRQAHAGSGHDHGASAVRELCRIVERIEAMSCPAAGLTFTVGRILGGEVWNSVPGHARAWVDLRADRPEDWERGLAAVEALAGTGTVRARSDGFACTVEVSRRPGYPPWPPNEATDRLAARVEAAARRLGQRVVRERRAGASDGCHLWDRAPTLDGLGPLGRHIHCSIDDPARGQEQESIVRRSLDQRTLLTAVTLAEIAAGAAISPPA
jgi:glutamate carboxypeptidase